MKNFYDNSDLPSLTKLIERLETLFDLSHCPQWLMSAFSRESKRLGVDITRLLHLWNTYDLWRCRDGV
uniref:Uncharacterized protein n=1 Tax=Cyanothece sp. (strain PCC 7425 / ATCC 29141) TaxID=395961 RepID=B8HN16_CYAP4